MSEEEEESLPTSNPTRSFSPMVQSPVMTPRLSEMTANGLGERRPSTMGSPTSEKDAQLSSPNGVGQAETTMMSSPARNRFASLVRAAVLMRRSASVATPAMMLASPTRRRTHSSSHQDTIGAFGVKGSRLATLTPKLKSLEPTQDLAAHQALVRHLQFSPDGKYMATSSWDRTSVVFKVGVRMTALVLCSVCLMCHIGTIQAVSSPCPSARLRRSSGMVCSLVTSHYYV
jgi:WD40 repeat protein